MLDRAKIARGIESRDEDQNGYKTTCTSAILDYLRIKCYHYSQTRGDVVRILRRHGWSVRSRKSQAGNCTVSQLRDKVRAGKIEMHWYLVVFVDHHVLMMKRNGNVIVDTDPRLSDRRRVEGVYTIHHPLAQPTLRMRAGSNAFRSTSA